MDGCDCIYEDATKEMSGKLRDLQWRESGFLICPRGIKRITIIVRHVSYTGHFWKETIYK